RIRQIPQGRILRTFKVGTPATLRLWADLLRHPFAPIWQENVALSSLAFGTANRLMAVAREAKTVHSWALNRAKPVRRLPSLPSLKASLVFAPDGRTLLSRGSDHSLRLWRLPGGTPLSQIRGEKDTHPFFDFSRDGRWLAWGWGQTIHLWDLV